MSLHAYAKKRRFAETPEPPPDRPAKRRAPRPIFVVQLHHARARHYDLRLEIDGVLKSWAVPKGPSLRPLEKRLAVEVEDHPLAYATFEGEIPEGQYGAGYVSVFDHGTFASTGDPLASLAEGKLEFVLEGRRLRGGWKLVRTARKGGAPNWLLMKMRDAEARDAEADDLLEAAPPHAVSSRTATRSTSKIGRLAARAAKRPGAKRGPVPEDLEPMLATPREKPPSGDHWLHEVKWDGYRLLASVEDGSVRLRSRNGLDYTAKLPSIRDALASLGPRSLRLDGELVVIGPEGRSDFGRLQRALAGKESHAVRYAVFDLLALEDVDLRGVALEDRKELLAALFRDQPSSSLFVSTHVVGAGEKAFAMSAEHGLEGIVSKRLGSRYTSTRSTSWIKAKHAHEDDFVVVGFTRPQGSRARFGALVLGRVEEDTLRYKGRVGSGFDEATLLTIGEALATSVRKTPPLEVPKGADVPRDVRWVEPTMVVDVAFRGVTEDGILRQATFLRVRDDRSPRRLEAAPTLAISHPERVVFPKTAHTKRDVVEYYRAVAEPLLLELRKRPLALVRCPSGIGEKCFFQKHADRSLGAHVHAIEVPEDEGRRGDVVYVDDAQGLVELAQHNVVELHTWGARIDDTERPDRLVFDLDPGEGITWPTMIDAAREVRASLERVGLASFVRLTGGNGLHVVVPIRRGPGWPEVAAFTEAFAVALTRTHPARYVATMGKARRRGRIFIDHLRNRRGATSVASWSLRAREHAGVAMPLDWSELEKTTGGACFDLDAAKARAKRRRRDPWEGIAASRQALPDFG